MQTDRQTDRQTGVVLYGFHRSSCSGDEELELERWRVEEVVMKEQEREEKGPFDFGNAKLDYDTKRASREGRTWSLILMYDIQGRIH